MKIDKNVPITETSYNSYCWGKMEVDDSAFFDNEPNGTRANPCVAARMWGPRNNAKFSARKEGNGVRIWRVA